MTKRAAKRTNTGGAGAPGGEVVWLPHSDRRLAVRGLWWYAKDRRRLRRLPDRAEGVVRPPVWDLAQQLASARICFRTDSPRLRVRGETDGPGPMHHMPTTGHSGLVLYEGGPRQMKPWAIAHPAPGATAFDKDLFANQPRRMREFTLYLPPYRGLETLELGFEKDARIEKPSPPDRAGPVVFYGTSITQGGCAHTAGADFVSAVGRLLNLDVVNLGFSGNGQGEPEMAGLVAEIDACLFVLDYVGNVDARRLRHTLPGFVKTIRARHPRTPIALLSGLMYSQCHVLPGSRQGQADKRDVMLHFYSQRRRAGDANLHFIDGNPLIPFGADFAYSDIGVHPASSGFQMMAQCLAPQIEYILSFGEEAP